MKTRRTQLALAKEVEEALQVPETAALETRTLHEARKLVDEGMPKMVTKLLGDFALTERINERIAIFKALAGFTLAHERLAKDMGLLKQMVEKRGGATNLNVIIADLAEARKGGPNAVERVLLEAASEG